MRVGDNDVTTRLSHRLEDADPSVVAAGATPLLQGPLREAARERLQRLLESDDPEPRVAALRQLRHATPEDVLALASPVLADPVPTVWAEVLETLTSTGRDAAIPPALEAL